mmetsp:Transcript_91420/g.212627  ORF Transcript_91420/g.212627 Transcript_91420/m.212627 type:complete len:106 (-) Transcript_91420:48-365(-)
MRRVAFAPALLMEDPAEDRELMLEAVKQDWQALGFAGEDLRTDRELLLAAASHHWRSLGDLEGSVDRGVLLQALQLCEEAQGMPQESKAALLGELRGFQCALEQR